MLQVITVVECDGDGCQAQISTTSHIAQVGLVELAARESGWITQETRRKKHPKWLCPNCKETKERSGADARGDLVEVVSDFIGQDEEESE